MGSSHGGLSKRGSERVIDVLDFHDR
jgi:hypothetical protein